MKGYKCDKCGQFFEMDENPKDYTCIPAGMGTCDVVNIKVINRLEGKYENIDLCPNCQTLFWKWIRQQ